ncbi:MAG: CshA/CshB family fibrillar adhesin-related protein [Agriterribacter sp.]
MRNYKQTTSAFFVLLFFFNFAAAQVGTGFFNGTVFNTYTNVNAGSLSGNNFTVSYSGTFDRQAVSSFTPGNMPSNTGYPTTNPPLLDLRADVNNYTQYTFTSNLPQFSTLFVEDIDYVGSINESVRIEFYDASSVLVNTSNIIIKTISTTGLPTTTKAATSITITGNGAAAAEPLVALTITSTTVRTVRITQLSSNSSAGSYALFFGILRTDHGDAPSGYGDAMHFPSTTLKLGTSGPDAEATAQFSTEANGDNSAASATVINDEDGVASFPALANDATSYSVNATVSNTTGANATLRGWIDFNRNGAFDASEASAVVTVANGATSATLNWTGLSGLIVGKTYARFRIASNAAEVTTPTGVAFTGEVEDYTFDITAITPLSFISLSASRSGNNILTIWKTATEFNVSHFVVEYSTDGINFINAGLVAALNGTENNYQFVLNNLAQPLYYIRVKSVDIDGAIKYSSMAIVKNTGAYARMMTVTPNPAVDNITVRISANMASPCEIKVFNAAGIVIFRNKTTLIKGENHLYINNLANAAKGTYIIQATIGNEQLTKKIVINR